MKAHAPNVTIPGRVWLAVLPAAAVGVPILSIPSAPLRFTLGAALFAAMLTGARALGHFGRRLAHVEPLPIREPERRTKARAA